MSTHPTPARLLKMKRRLRDKGYSQQAAADLLGVTLEHLNRVLNGHRESRRLLAAIEELPAREVSHA